MLSGSSSSVARGLRVGNCIQQQLGSLQELLSLPGAHDNNTHKHHEQQQQEAWLPLHTASDRLARDLRHTAQRVFQGLAQYNNTSSSPLLRCQQQQPQQQLHPLIASPVRHAHSSSSSSSSSGRKVGRVGRSHRPLFSPRNSSRQQTAAAALAAATDSEDDDTESDADEQQQAPTSPLDLRNPERAYPIARANPRQLTAHLGPTNSGKTHAALAALAAAPTGVYCGPLRLLACEVADRLNAMGVPCNLVTGQEVRRVKGARHTACTVEMADLSTPVDVGVLDEVQMLGDQGRGWSWTRVLLGMPAAELHLCGDPAAADLLERLAADCGDTLSIQRYRRLAPLIVEPEALSGLHEIRDGDCVVAFGRKTLHKLRRNILMHMLPNTQGTAASGASGSDASTDTDDSDYAAATEPPGWYSNSCSSSDNDDAGRADVCDERRQQQQQQDQQQQQEEAATARAFQGVGMVYGALPPESRRTQAALFNARGDVWPRSSVLLASDAIGMGLNLNIRRIVFTTLHKYDGVETRPLSASEIKQIAGRAGRYASGHAEGFVCVLNPDDLSLLREALATATPQVTQACLLPRYEQLEQYALDHMAAVQQSHSQHHSVTTSSSNGLDFGAPLGRHHRQQQPVRPLSMHKLLKIFIRESQLSGCYVLADMKNMIQLAKLLRHLEPLLSRADMYTLCISPASADDGPVVQALLHIAGCYVYDRHVTPDCLPIRCPDQPPRSPAEMKTAEEVFRVLDLYLWLANDRLGSPGVFKDRREVEEQRQQVAGLIDVALQRMGGVAHLA